MGVTGLWRLIEPAGKPVPVETLENKVLAVDISIWLHQMVKGYQDAKGAPLPNAHLMGLFQRLCKLLYFRIKPVFVFDGGFPDLKKETIAKRQDNKSRYNSQSEKLKREIALLLGKKTAITALLGQQISPKKSKQVEDKDDIFKLPALPEKDVESESESDDEQNSSASTVDLHSVDLESDKFKNMPLKDKYDLLVELKETRKMNSWGKIHTLPKKSDNFSDFQMQRLLKRRKVQECLQETEKEMGDGGMSLIELESLLNEEGIDTKLESLPGKRIASNNTTRYLLISNVKQALADAKKKEIEALKQSENQPGTSADQDNTVSNCDHDELEDDLQKAIKMSLECVDEAETSIGALSKTDDSWTSFLTDSDYSDDEDDDGFVQPDMSSAKAYIMQYTDLTHKAIDQIVAPKPKNKNMCKESKIDEVIDELNREKTIIEDNIELTSSDEEAVQKSSYEINEIVTKSEQVTPTQSIVNENTVSDRIKNNDLITGNENDMDKINNTQISVLYVENTNDEIISLETSTEDIEHQKIIEQPNSKLDLDSESSEDDFEEVSDNDAKLKEPVIQLTLDMGKQVEDDIFADIFDDNVNNLNIANISNSENPVKKVKTPLHGEEQKIKPDIIENKIRVNHEVSMHIKNDENIYKSNDKLKLNNVEEISSCTVNLHGTSTQVNNENKQLKPDEKRNSTISQIQNEEISLPELMQLDHTVQNDAEEINKEAQDLLQKTNKEVISIEQLNSIVSEIENEQEDLLQEKGRLDRVGRNITEQMTKEAQELLRVFGVPYIVAPMEAEAQCAFLEIANLTDGTITDDSDIWLFGGKTVYKNFFNHKKHVLQFLSERIEKSFNLSREQLVLLSLLVGSDYTTGVTGVGPVTALEILASFPFSKKKITSEHSKQNQYQELVTGLKDFKKWVKAGKRTDNVSLKKKLKNINLTEDFPSVRVVQAYMEPNVQRSKENFSWGKPDITILREYTKTKFGWSQNKLDEIIKPVLKRMLDRKNQKSVSDYFKRKSEFHSLEDQMSKRVKAAVQKMSSDVNLPENNDEADKQKIKRKRKIKTNDSNKPQSQRIKAVADETKNIEQVLKASVLHDSEKSFEINVTKSERYQEVIPQRERDKKHLFENKLRAIELFRKTKIDRKKKATKRKLPVPKEKADLSESDSD